MKLRNTLSRRGTWRLLAAGLALAAPALALAQVADSQADLQVLPEPEVLALFGVGAIAWWVARRGRK